MPSASVRMAAAEKVGCVRRLRTADRRSLRSPVIALTQSEKNAILIYGNDWQSASCVTAFGTPDSGSGRRRSEGDQEGLTAIVVVPIVAVVVAVPVDVVHVDGNAA